MFDIWYQTEDWNTFSQALNTEVKIPVYNLKHAGYKHITPKQSTRPPTWPERMHLRTGGFAQNHVTDVSNCWIMSVWGAWRSANQGDAVQSFSTYNLFHAKSVLIVEKMKMFSSCLSRFGYELKLNLKTCTKTYKRIHETWVIMRGYIEGQYHGTVACIHESWWPLDY